LPQLLRPPPWTDAASCAGLVTRDEDVWHPHDDLPPQEKAVQYAVARLVCAGCPVRHPCALEALHGGIGHGMFGGLTPADRRKIARRHGYPQPGAAQHGQRSRYVAGCHDGPDGKACRPCLNAHRAWVAEQRARRPRAVAATGRRRRQLDPRAKVLRAVKRADGPVTARAVYRATGVKVRDVRAIVATAVAAGELAPGLVA
jgi:hypothetical protein